MQIVGTKCERIIFSRRVNRRPSDEEARSVRNKQRKDSSSRTRRLEEIINYPMYTVL